MKETTKCHLCGFETIEGYYGESKYICQNSNCERSNRHWAIQNVKKILQPLSGYLNQSNFLRVSGVRQKHIHQGLLHFSQ